MNECCEYCENCRCVTLFNIDGKCEKCKAPAGFTQQSTPYHFCGEFNQEKIITEIKAMQEIDKKKNCSNCNHYENDYCKKHHFVVVTVELKLIGGISSIGFSGELNMVIHCQPRCRDLELKEQKEIEPSKVMIGNYYPSWEMGFVMVQCQFIDSQHWGTSRISYHIKKPTPEQIEDALAHGFPELKNADIFTPDGSHFQPKEVFDEVTWSTDNGYGTLYKNKQKVGTARIWRDCRRGKVDEPVPSPWQIPEKCKKCGNP